MSKGNKTKMLRLISHLQLRKRDSKSDIAPHGRSEDTINLKEQVDEDSLDRYWDQVVSDIHNDPEWFTFADE